MASKRRPIHTNSASKLNFRPASSTEVKNEPKGTKPLPDPTPVLSILLYMLQHVCKKVVFVNIKYRLAVYFGAVFILSVIVDILPFPKTYLARKDNILNQYFVKISWGWTLLLTFTFVVLTSYTYCCGQKDRVVKHCSRLVVATSMWFFWVNLFNYIENTYGKCNVKGGQLQTKSSCVVKGYSWQSIDLSGHCFILIYSTLVMIEESRAIVGWEGIRTLLIDEEHAREIEDTSARVNPLRNLPASDLSALKINYDQYTLYIRLLFVGITLFTMLWDLMLLGTILYFHNMIEKLVACIIAVGSWGITYKVWFPVRNVLPPLPGEGVFKYQDVKLPKEVKTKSRGADKAKGPRFMGMPLRVPKEEEKTAPNGSEDKTTSVGA